MPAPTPIPAVRQQTNTVEGQQIPQRPKPALGLHKEVLGPLKATTMDHGTDSAAPPTSPVPKEVWFQESPRPDSPPGSLVNSQALIVLLTPFESTKPESQQSKPSSPSGSSDAGTTQVPLEVSIEPVWEDLPAALRTSSPAIASMQLIPPSGLRTPVPSSTPPVSPVSAFSPILEAGELSPTPSLPESPRASASSLVPDAQAWSLLTSPTQTLSLTASSMASPSLVDARLLTPEPPSTPPMSPMSPCSPLLDDGDSAIPSLSSSPVPASSPGQDAQSWSLSPSPTEGTVVCAPISSQVLVVESQMSLRPSAASNSPVSTLFSSSCKKDEGLSPAHQLEEDEDVFEVVASVASTASEVAVSTEDGDLQSVPEQESLMAHTSILDYFAVSPEVAPIGQQEQEQQQPDAPLSLVAETSGGEKPLTSIPLTQGQGPRIKGPEMEFELL